MRTDTGGFTSVHNLDSTVQFLPRLLFVSHRTHSCGHVDMWSMCSRGPCGIHEKFSFLINVSIVLKTEVSV